MRRPLFWKIFFGICVTCFVVSQIVWVTYAILSPRPSETTRALARISLAAARQSIEIGGQDALAKQIFHGLAMSAGISTTACWAAPTPSRRTPTMNSRHVSC